MKIKPLILTLSSFAILSLSNAANAADGCKFMLCMGAANPMGIAECASTVREVLHDLAKGRPLPTCKMGNGLDSKTSGSYVSYRRAPTTPPCPDKTHQGTDGIVYHPGKKPANISPFNGYRNLPVGYKNIPMADSLLNQMDYSQKVCIGGNKNGTLAASSYSENSTPEHQWWDILNVVKPDGATYEFSFYVDNALFSTHRF